MLWFILAIVLVIVIGGVGIWKDWSAGSISFLAVFVLLGVSLIPPACIDLGYKEKQLETTVELVSLGTEVTSVGSGNRRYVTVSGEKVYTYRYEVENTTNLEGTMYKTETVSGNVEEIESEKCETPMLYIYVEKSKNSWWFSMHTNDRYTYVFYVPEGTIVRDVTLD